MSKVSDMLFDMLNLEQKTFLSMKCTLYQDNWEDYVVVWIVRRATTYYGTEIRIKPE